MKDVMARESSKAEQGVPTFEYNPFILDQGILFELSRPLDELRDMLLEQFAGRAVSVEDIYSPHHVGRRFIKKNYKNILMKLESDGIVKASPPAGKRRSGTMADHVLVTFPAAASGPRSN